MKQKQTVWITGVRSGVGEALATAFLEGGWRVFGSSRTRPRKDSVWHRHPDAHFVPLDVRSTASVQKAWLRIRDRVSSLDMLINNAGVTAFKEVVKTDPKEFGDIIDTNLTGLFLTTRAVLPSMRRRKKGTIVTILSYAAKTVYTMSGAYAASKAGADMFLRVVREENRDAGIRVVNVFPGAVDTPMWSPSMRKDHGSSMMTAEHVASAVFDLTAIRTTVVPEEIVLRPEIGDLTI